jgi:hypothetical protein
MINWLMLFKKIIAVYTKKLTNPYTQNLDFFRCKSRWCI